MVAAEPLQKCGEPSDAMQRTGGQFLRMDAQLPVPADPGRYPTEVSLIVAMPTLTRKRAWIFVGCVTLIVLIGFRYMAKSRYFADCDLVSDRGGWITTNYSEIAPPDGMLDVVIRDRRTAVTILTSNQRATNIVFPDTAQVDDATVPKLAQALRRLDCPVTLDDTVASDTATSILRNAIGERLTVVHNGG